VVDWKPYLESICEKYAQWWDTYTLTNVVGNKSDKKVRKCLFLDLQAIAVKPETVKPEREQFLETREEREVFNVLEGLRKYAPEHVLLSGRPGSGKSTALVRLLLEEAQGFGNEKQSVIARNVRGASRREAISSTRGNSQIPVLVELRYYETSILDLITAFLHRHDPSLTIDCETIKTLLRQGQFLLLLDGVNELPSQEAQRNLQKFRQDYQPQPAKIF
jgi:predicted NACHT family NTPase